MRKQVKALFDDNKAVSPVIGVILMVAITVILAAVIGTMVMDMTEGVGNTTPTAKFDVTDHADAYGPNDTASPEGAYQITHTDGEDIQTKNIEVLVKTPDGTTIARFSSSAPVVTTTGNDVELQYNGVQVDGTETISAGDTLTLEQTTDSGTNGDVFTNGLGDYQIQIIYTKGDSGSTIADATVELQ